jgi:hypothetical protein
MADYRQLHTKTWVDSWFLELTPEQKLLFIHLFSNARASVCGLYELPIRVLSFETGLERPVIEKCLELFAHAGKVYYDFQTSVVWVVHMAKYQSSSSPKLKTRIEADIKAVPDCELKRSFLEKYPEYTVSIPHRYGMDTLQSVSVSDPVSVSVEEGGVGGETIPASSADPENEPPGPAGVESTPALAEFSDHFGNFNGAGERRRWLTLVESIGMARAREVAAWGERREIHRLNRGGLLDSLETAAKKWQPPRPPPGGKPSPEERQRCAMEAIRQGVELAFESNHG